jgi:hypothetical protein
VTEPFKYLLCRKLKEQEKKARGGEKRGATITATGIDIKTDTERYV